MRTWIILIGVLFLGVLAPSTTLHAQCSDGLDSIQQVTVRVNCNSWLEIRIEEGERHPAYSYTLDVGDVINGLPFASDTVEFDYQSLMMNDTLFRITEKCNGGADSSVFVGGFPDFNSPGTWMFQRSGLTGLTGSGSIAMNTIDSSLAFSPDSPVDLPVLIDEANLSGTTSTVIRPTCMGEDDGRFTIELTYNENSIDSFIYTSNTSGGAFIASSTLNSPGQTSTTFTVEGAIPAGMYVTTVQAFSGTCTDMFEIMTTVGEGSNEPVVACNSDLNITLDPQCMVDIYPDLILASTSSPCVPSLMDSVVVKYQNGTMLDPNIIGYNDDTLRILDASELIKVPLIIEVHSSGDGASNSCWGNLLLEDKTAPILTCESLTVPCYAFEGDLTDNVAALDCDPDPVINLINQNTITNCSAINPTGGPLGDSIIKRIIRTFNAVDNQGNISTSCTDTLDIRRLDADLTNNTGANPILDIVGLKYPSDRLVNNNTAIICNSTSNFADEDNDNIPDPVDFIINGTGDTLYGAGIPVIDTLLNGDTLFSKLYPSNVDNPHPDVVDLLERCKVIVSVQDIVLPSIGCVQKVRRMWTISEWVCNVETKREFQQTIEILDNNGPEIEVPADMKVTTNRNDCTRSMSIPTLISATDACQAGSTALRVEVNVFNDNVLVGGLSSTNGTYSAISGGTMNLPRGINSVVYTVFDHCHNPTSDSITIEVVDESAPVMISKEFVTMSLSADDGVWLGTGSIDNGSFDDCGLASLCIVRMDDLDRFDALLARGAGDTLDDGTTYVILDSLNNTCGQMFGASGTTPEGFDYIIKSDLCTPEIEFCCNDAGTTQMVVLRGTDKSGNINQAMSTVTIQDKRQPSVHCPPNLTVDCGFTFTTDSIFGNVVANGTQQAINIPANQIIEIQEGKSLIDGTWTGNCDATVSVSVDRVVNRCSAGTIDRVFTVTGGNLSSSCTQRITIMSTVEIDPDDIVFPSDTAIEGCNNPTDFGIDITGRPTYPSEACLMLGDTHEDLEVNFNNGTDGSCYKIVRRWTVIDWCVEPSVVVATHTQSIKVNDTTAPQLLNGGNCEDQVINVTECENPEVTISQRGIDNCTTSENLTWIASVDFNSDGSNDRTYNLTSTIDDKDAVGTITDNIPHGIHSVTWSLYDQCGNVTPCTHSITVVNDLQPTSICRTSITGSMMPVDDGSGQNGQPDDDVAGDGIADNGMIEVWADEYNIGSSTHECGYEIIYSFAADQLVPSRILTCVDYTPTEEGGSVVIDMEVYAVAVLIAGNDTTIINSSVCNSEFVLMDTRNTCNSVVNDPANTQVLIQGNINTINGDHIPSVDVELASLALNPTTESLETTTDQYGEYAFPYMNTGPSYEITPLLDKDLLNGVSTLDLVLIQKHILGQDPIRNPYNVIAADINNDGVISAIDMIELRKAILEVSDSFTNNTSWRFINGGYTFREGKNPLKENFPHTHVINDLVNDMNIDFVGVKVGDINESVNVSQLITDSRFRRSVSIENRMIKAEEIIEIPVNLSTATELIGYQQEFEFDPSSIGFLGVESGVMDINSKNIGTQNAKSGRIKISWHEISPKSVDTENHLYTLKFIAKKDGELSQFIHSGTNAFSEYYDADMNVMSLQLEIVGAGQLVNESFDLLQNTPNPFTERTSISFIMESEGEAQFEIFGIDGTLIYQENQVYPKGENMINLTKKQLGNMSGVMVYKITSGSQSLSKEMILID